MVDFVKILQNLEPVFKEAGQLALKMQQGVRSHDKQDTQYDFINIVTEADFAVQEFILQKIVNTDLILCRLLAEEDTPSTNKFNEQGKYYLSIDPIDGTASYARGDKRFSVIIALHDGEKFLYTFVYYPAMNITVKVVNGKYFFDGEIPDFSLSPDAQKTIVYWLGDLKKNISSEIYDKLQKDGFMFKNILELHPNPDSILMLAGGCVAGLYREDMNAYDGMVEFNIAKAKGLKVYPENFENLLNLKDIKQKKSDLYYSGYYLVLNKEN